METEFSKLEFEQPRLSKPTVALAVPVKESAKIREPRGKSMDFSSPDVEQPMVAPQPQQPIFRGEPRDQQARDDTPRLLRTPRIFSDPDEEREKAKQSGQNAAANSTPPGRENPRSPWSGDTLGTHRADSQHALSPVTDFNWDTTREKESRSKDPLWNGKSTTKDRNGARARGPFAAQEDSAARFSSGRPDSLADLFGGQAKEKPTPAQLERRAEFQQLLNPNAALAGKAQDSLQPVVNAADAKPGALAAPTLGGILPGAGPVDPMTAFNQKHDHLRGPVLEDFNKKYTAPSLPAASSLDSRGRTPLNQQPAFRDFPTRSF